jgi:hypothetical protein
MFAVDRSLVRRPGEGFDFGGAEFAPSELGATM